MIDLTALIKYTKWLIWLMINKATPYDVLLSGGMAESAVSKETTNASKFMYIFLWQGENENHSAIISAFN